MKTPQPIAKDGKVSNFKPGNISLCKVGQTFRTMRGVEYVMLRNGLVMNLETMEEAYFPSSFPIFLKTTI